MKRSNSAPMIPELVQAELKPPTANSTLLSRRGLSTSNVSLPGDYTKTELSPKRQSLASPLPLSRINSPTSRQHRVEQLKKEENIDERKNEREVQEQIQLNKTWIDNMKLDPDEPEFRSESMEVLPTQSPSNQSFVSPSSPLTSRMRSRSLTPTSPSSARTFSYRRSCSPVLVLRPSSLTIGTKRKERPEEDMETSPSVPSKRLQLGGYASPLNLSPCVSPLMGNSPLHHSFSTTSRKSSTTQSESTPLSSPSSLAHSANPFAINYDSGNCEHWQSHSGSASGSTCSSASQSPPGIQVVINEDHKNNTSIMMLDSNAEVTNEAPTPLSPKGLQFRQKLFHVGFNNIPSPIPRILPSISTPNTHVSTHANVMNMIPVSGRVSGLSSSSNGLMTTVKHLHHDKHLSPFNSDISHGHSHILHPHPPHTHPHTLTHGRIIRTATKSRLRHITNPLRPTASASALDYNRATGTSSTNRLSISSPLAKLSMTSTIDESTMNSISTTCNSVSHGVHVSEQKMLRVGTKRRASETSTDSQEDSLMESDNDTSMVNNLEHTLENGICEGRQKSFDSNKIIRTLSSAGGHL